MESGQKMKNVIHIEDVVDIRKINPCRVIKLLIDEESTGAEKLSMGLSIIDPKGELPLHVHENEEEAMYVIHGTGKAIFDEKEYEIKENTAIFAPPKVKHTIANTGNEKLWLLFIYSPPGPERVVKPK